MNELTDDDLMRMFRDGDQEAFEALFNRYHASVYNYARHMLRDPHRAEDVLQDTLVAVARAAGRYEARGCFRTWLMRICRNKCLNVIEAERRRRSAMRDTDLQVLEPASDGPSPPERVQAGERVARVRRAISGLPERQREAIVLYAFEQMTYREISEVLDVPIGTVKTLIHRGRVALAEMLERRDRDAV